MIFTQRTENEKNYLKMCFLKWRSSFGIETILYLRVLRQLNAKCKNKYKIWEEGMFKKIAAIRESEKTGIWEEPFASIKQGIWISIFCEIGLFIYKFFGGRVLSHF